MICHNYSVRAADQLQVFNVDNNNNPTTISDTTTIATSGPGSVKYLQWCEKNNPKHPDSCDCHWEEYQV
jgi:hypothetical protein